MSRSTQFIGLNLPAQNFVNNLTAVSTLNKTSGMFGEDIPLGVWEDKYNVYEEEVVATPWSI